MAAIEFRLGWQKRDTQLKDDARQFWREMDVMSSEEIELRAAELCALAYADGKVIAASTAHFYDYPRLRSRFAFYRTMVRPELRRQRISARLCVFARDSLSQWAKEHPEEGLCGLIAMPQAEEYRDHLWRPVIKHHGLEFVLVGYLPNGYQVRVLWFDHATVEVDQRAFLQP